MSFKTFEGLLVWQKSHSLVLDVYNLSKTFPKEEMYGLTSQIRRSSASVPTNIVEGYRRKSNKDFSNFLNIAETSLEETKYQLILCKDLGYIETNKFKELREKCNEVGKMIYGLKNSINSSLVT